MRIGEKQTFLAIFDKVIDKIDITTTVNEKQSKIEPAEVLSTIETKPSKKKCRGIDCIGFLSKS